MLSRFKMGLKLMGETFAILKKDKELVLFPIVSGIITLIIVATFFVPFVFMGIFTSAIGTTAGQIFMFAVLFIFYLVTYFVVIFFNVGLISCAKIRIDGGDPTFGDGITAAKSHFGSILTWAAISATVGVILQIIRGDSDNFLMSILSSLIGAAWSLVTFFVIPVMIFENMGAIDAIKESWTLFKRTWGETVIGGFSLGIIFIPAILLIVLSFGVLSFGSFELFMVAISISVFLLIATAILHSALQGIFVTVMYTYAKTGVVAEGISREMIENAFVPKRGLLSGRGGGNI